METEESETGKLYLIPTLLGEVEPLEVLPLAVKKVLSLADFYIAENEKSARAFIKKVFPAKHQPDLEIFTLNKFTDPADYASFLEPCLRGNHVGLMSEAGAPGIADPGQEIVRLAHDRNIRVVPLVGPSSIFMALMASGMNGQSFAFSGYLPIEKEQRYKRLRWLEKESRKTGQSQIFMETPYRNEKLFADILLCCRPETRLCLARNISLQDEYIKSAPLSWWKEHRPDLDKKPCIFILDAGSDFA